VIAAGPGNRDDEPGIGDHQERNPDSPDDRRRDELALRERRPGEGELVDSERHEVGRQARVDQRVPDGPPADQTGRLAEEEGGSLFPQCSCRHMHSSGYPDLSSNARLGGIRRLHLVCQRSSGVNIGLWCFPALPFMKLRPYALLFQRLASSTSQLVRAGREPQPFTSMYLATFPFFSFRSSTAPCSTPSV